MFDGFEINELKVQIVTCQRRRSTAGLRIKIRYFTANLLNSRPAQTFNAINPFTIREAHSAKIPLMAMQPMLNIAVRAARSAGNIIARSIDRLDQLTVTVKSENDFVSEVDRQAEQEIIHTIRRAYPNHGILGEETGEHAGDDFVWIIDPLDGTTNFLHGFPQFAVSIGIKHKGRMEHAVVYDPLRQELFTASRGGGAQLNDRRIRVSKHAELDAALLGTGFPFKQQHYLDVYLDTFKALFPMTAGIRRAGSAALDLAYVAAGRFDGFWR